MAASLFASLLPKLNPPKPPPPVLPNGFVGAEGSEPACANRLGEDDLEESAGLGAKSEVVGCWEPASACLFCAPNKGAPGGGPAGVVEFSVKVFEVAGVDVPGHYVSWLSSPKLARRGWFATTYLWCQN